MNAFFRVSFRNLLTVLLAVVCSSTVFAQIAPSQVAARTQYFPDSAEGIHLEMIFNYNLGDPQSEEGVVDMVWGSNFAMQPPGVYNTAYIPYSVDNFTNPVAWYQANHPDWLEYLCDQKTLAFEFGTTTLAPLDFSNPALRALRYFWRVGAAIHGAVG